MSSNVQLIDPLLPNVPSYMDGDDRKPIFQNGIPPYEDMHIYAELVAERRGRTVLETNNKGLKPNLIRTGLESDVIINFLGFNQNEDSPDNGSFTTRYYDGSVSDGIQHDSFGITKIKTLINSSYIPQIDIEFTDVRGLSFFNRENSPYRIIFDFPPPIFYLTLKGYYGKALEYQMHLVKYTTSFDSNTGNYIINAKFVAITYAPLTDILFKYVLNFGLLRRDNISINLDNTKPKTTFELIQKLKVLYDKIKNEVRESEDNEKYERALVREERLNELLLILNNYNTLIENVNTSIKTPLSPVLFIQNTESGEDFGSISVINNIRDFDSIIQSEDTSGIPINMNKKLYVGVFIVGKFGEGDAQVRNDRNQVQALNIYKEKLKESANNKLGNGFINDNDFGDIETIQNTPTWGELNQQLPSEYLSNIKIDADNDNTELIVWYRGFNITNYYLKIYKEKSIAEEDKNVSANIMNENVNALITKRLGMLPTIYNVFKIILDDVDHFFQTMRDTAISAENHHNNKYRDVILSNAGNNFGDKMEKNDNLYAFPLILKQEESCGAIKKVKIAPVALSDSLPEEFPEINLLDDFISSFIIYNDVVQLQNIKNEKDGQGSVKWLPCHPTDTNLFSSLPSSPYIGIDNPLSESLNIDPDNQLDKILKIILERYYVISQNTIRDYFITKSKESEVFIDLYADSEAANVANSIISKSLAEYILGRFKNFTNYSNLISYLSTNNTFDGVYTFNNEQIFKNVSNGPNLYVNRKNPQYKGLAIKDANISIRQVGGDRENPIDEFMNNIQEEHWDKQDKVRDDYKFTDSNLIYFSDGGSTSIGNYGFKTKFVAANYNEDYEKLFSNTIFGERYILWRQNFSQQTKKVFTVFERISQLHTVTGISGRRLTYEAQDNTEDRNIIQEIASIGGNKEIYNLLGSPQNSFKKDIDFSNDIVSIWAIELTLNGDYIVNLDKYGNGNIDNNENKFIRSLMYLSSFGWAQSPFSRFPYGYNLNLFQIPAAIQMPSFLLAYMGALVNIEETQDYENLVDFFNGKDLNININPAVNETNVLQSGGYFIFSDIHDINKYLSKKDKETLKNEYDKFMSDSFQTIDNNIQALYSNVIENAKENCNVSGDGDKKENKLKACRANLFDEELRNSENIFRLLMNRKVLLNYNTITFNTTNPDDNTDYSSLSNINDDNTIINTNTQKFFTTLMFEAVEELQRRIEFLEEKEKKFKRSVDDTDIYTQTYYSFKNINDKWLAGLNKNTKGYPFKDNGSGSLIDQFVFVDRALNPIGDTIIDLKTLLDLENDTRTSIFTVLSQLLSVNGFEFFPLQNFMTFEQNDWEKSFKIDNGPIKKQFPTFVCMYIGGTASYPTGGNSFYEDDGIVNLENPEVADFSTEGCEPNEELDNQKLNKDGKFYYAQPKAFKVRFGEQNQSMFKDIQIDSKEYPETNESLSILGQIAGDSAEQIPIPKGQNLYNLYENRSYKATIMGLGNVMIQPTQYFQLENVPLFNGAYVILEVEHNIVPNKMETSFSGTKLLKYPLPRVTNPATIFGFEGGAADNTQPSYDTVSDGVGTANNPPETQHNDFYYLTI